MTLIAGAPFLDNTRSLVERSAGLRVQRPVVGDELHLAAVREISAPLLLAERDGPLRLEVIAVPLEDLRHPHHVPLDAHLLLVRAERLGLARELLLELLRRERLLG